MTQKLLESEINANSRYITFLELIISEPSEDGRLANRWRTHDNEFEYVVVIFLHNESYNYSPMLNLSQFLTLSMKEVFSTNNLKKLIIVYSIYY